MGGGFLIKGLLYWLSLRHILRGFVCQLQAPNAQAKRVLSARLPRAKELKPTRTCAQAVFGQSWPWQGYTAPRCDENSFRGAVSEAVQRAAKSSAV